MRNLSFGDQPLKVTSLATISKALAIKDYAIALIQYYSLEEYIDVRLGAAAAIAPPS